MKLTIFTPACKASAIGRMAALLAHELLVRNHEVTVVRTEAEHLLSTDTHDFGTVVLPWDDEATISALIRASDACVHQIGNNFEFHEGSTRWLSEFPGLTCLHDFFLGHFFCGWARKNRAQANAVLENWYGDVVARKFFAAPDDNTFIEHTHEVAPMTEWIASQSLGVIAHSQWGCQRVMRSCPGPVRVVPLAYDAPEAGTRIAVDQRRAAAPLLKLLTIGHVNPNKRVECVIKAIGFSPLLRQYIEYRLIGAIAPSVKKQLQDLATRLGVRLVISGEVDDLILSEAIAASDVVSCLRWPVLESASASAIEAMLYGKVALVTNIGFYSEIPDECAIKIEHPSGIVDIQAALVELVQDRARIAERGAAAQRWAAATFTAMNYADQLEELVLDVFRVKPILNAVNHLSDTLRQWASGDVSHMTAGLLADLEIFNLDQGSNARRETLN